MGQRTNRGKKDDPFLRGNSCSQLALLSDHAYQDGIGKIANAVRVAESRGERLIFSTELFIYMLVGIKPAETGFNSRSPVSKIAPPLCVKTTAKASA